MHVFSYGLKAVLSIGRAIESHTTKLPLEVQVCSCQQSSGGWKPGGGGSRGGSGEEHRELSVLSVN